MQFVRVVYFVKECAFLTVFMKTVKCTSKLPWLLDMFDMIVKFGSYIVDGLREYQQPILIYIPPYGELRGGAWVVLDPKINPEFMEMYADRESRSVCGVASDSMKWLIMTTLHSRCGDYIFCPVSFFFFSLPNLSGRRMDVYRTEFDT